MRKRREVGSAAAELRELGGGDDEGRRMSGMEKEIRRGCSQRGGGDGDVEGDGDRNSEIRRWEFGDVDSEM